jgi:uncharacterized protein YgiM (DUF1202 family)
MRRTTFRMIGAAAGLAFFLSMATAFTLPVQAATGTASGTVNVRSQATTSSDKVTSISAGDTVTLGDVVTNDAGEEWYPVTTSDGKTGYIRSDMLSVADGTTSTAGDSTSGSSATGTSAAGTDASSTDASSADGSSDAAAAASTEVPTAQGDGYAAAMTPTTATVSEDVNVRSGAGTSYTKIGTLSANTALVVIGQAKDSAGDIWYQFYTTGTEQQMTGFIRYDYLTLGGPAETASTEASTEEAAAAASSTADYEAVYTADESGSDTWYLYNNVAGTRTKITDIDSTINDAKTTEAAAQASLKKWKMAGLGAGILLLAAIAGIIALFLKVKRAENEAGEVDLASPRAQREREKRFRDMENGSSGAVSRGQGSRPEGRNAGDRPAYPAGRSMNRPTGSDGRPMMRDGEVRRSPNPDRSADTRPQRPGVDRTIDRTGADRDVRRPDVRRPVRPDSTGTVQRNTADDDMRQRPRRPVQNSGTDTAARRDSGVQNFADMDDDEFQFINIDDDNK